MRWMERGGGGMSEVEVEGTKYLLIWVMSDYEETVQHSQPTPPGEKPPGEEPLCVVWVTTIQYHNIA